MVNTQVSTEPGTLDPSFGSGGDGKVVLPFPGVSGAVPTAVYALPDNRLLVAVGASPAEGAPAKIVMLNEKGDIDTTFAFEGVADLPLDGSDWFFPQAIYPLDNGWIITGEVTKGTDDDPDLAVVKLKSSGQFDGTFGVRGKAIFRIVDFIGSEAAEGVKFISRQDYEKRTGDNAMAKNASGGAHSQLQSDKIILVSTVFFKFNDLRVLVLCLGPDGSLDRSFNGTGFRFVDVPNYVGRATYVNGVKVQPDLKILICGSVVSEPPGEYFDAYVMRCNPNGTDDISFGDAKTGAVIISKSGEWLSVNSMTLKPDGGVIAVGSSGANSALIVVFNQSGSFNKVFNQGQPLFSHFLRNLSWHKCVLQQDGKIITNGIANSMEFPAKAATVIARFDAGGNLDLNYAKKGWVSIEEALAHTILEDVALTQSNKVVVATYAFEIGQSISGRVTRFLNQ